MTRSEILSVIHTSLDRELPPEKVETILSSIEGTLADWDAVEPFPSESEFQAFLSEQVYPILALYHAIHDGETNKC